MRGWHGGILAAVALLWGCSSIAPTRWLVSYHSPSPMRAAPVLLRDEFTELDDPDTVSAGISTADSALAPFLEHARAYYLQALQFIEQGDTARAAAAFERAVSILHSLSATPKLSRSVEFSELVQSVLEDYETYIRSAELVDPNSGFFLIREQLLRLVEEVEAQRRVAPLPELSSSEPVAGLLPATTIPLPRNEWVERALEFLTKDRGRRFMQRWLERSGRFFPLIRRILAEEKMPEELAYLTMIESGLNPFAVSWAGAVGLWQFIRSTGELYGLRVTPWVDERRDPEKSTRAALQHLRDLYTEFGDWHLALAAYNCGAQAVRRALLQASRSHSDSLPSPSQLSFWDIREYLPRETRNYVPLYIATTLIALNPRAYGFEGLTYEPEYVYDTYELNEPMNLSALARCLAISPDSLRQLNPELLTMSTPPDMLPYRLKIPLGTRGLLAQCLLTLSPKEKQPWIVHTVRRRESLASIAARYGVSVEEIRRINRVGKRLRPGMRLRIPVVPSPSAAPETLPAPPTQAVADSAPRVSPQYSRIRVHVVRRGQTLSEIAALYGVTVAQLKAWNGLRSERIRAGQKLRIYLSTPVAVLHRVRRGETAHAIAQRYGVSVEDLRRWNPSSFRRGRLLAGTTLRIYLSSPAPLDGTTAQSPGRTYIVQPGDTLFSIARRFGVSVEELRKHNDLDGDVIWVGQRLRIPQ